MDLSSPRSLGLLGLDDDDDDDDDDGGGLPGLPPPSPSPDPSHVDVVAPRLIRSGATSAIYRQGDVGYKVLLGGTSADPENHSKLLHELHVHNYLPPHVRRRRVVDVTAIDGRPALAFKWTSGITLGEWLRKVRSNGGGTGISSSSAGGSSSSGGGGGGVGADDDGLLHVRLRAAMAIASTLSDFHAGGVAHNGLGDLSNVILAPAGGEYAATFVDLSASHITRGASKEMEKMMRAADLRSLGSVLNRLFRGKDDGDGGGGGGSGSGAIEDPLQIALNGALGDAKAKRDPRDGVGLEGDSSVVTVGDSVSVGRRKRGKQQAAGEGLPLYLCALISALSDIDTTFTKESEQTYNSARDVFLDLRTMAENANIANGNKGCLWRNTPWDLGSANERRLRLRGDGDGNNVFYGRQVQTSMLMHLFQSSVALGREPLMATISGYPGTGKSTLVNQLKKPILDSKGCFVEGKFDKCARPDTVLASALDSFFGDILESGSSWGGGNNVHISMKWRIHDAIGSFGSNVLLEMLPNLRRWLLADGSSDGGAATGGPGGAPKGIGLSHRLKFMFCKLVGAIACRARPLVLFLDDLQWADETTLDIIRMMMTDPDIRHFLFLGCYRDNEVNLSHPLTIKLNDIQEQGVSIVTVKLGPIEKESVNTLLSEVLCLPPSLCRPLSEVVHSKTGGIILFILRFLSSLNDEGDIWFSMTSRQWMYHLEGIRQKKIHSDVVSHMTEQMKNLPKKMQTGLKIAACLGPKLEANVLEKAKKGDEIEETFLKFAVEFGFLQNLGPERYVWAHDQIQQAAYDLIPLVKRDSFHLLVGSRVFIMTSSSEMDSSIFYIVDNMNRGAHLVVETDQKYELSQLNLEAGQKALASSAFHSAAKYFLKGLSLLGPDSWEVKYNLTVNLYDAASEALFVTGDFTRLTALTEEPLAKALSFEDKLNCLNNLVRAAAASSKFEEGISMCVSILSQLEEEIPTEITAIVYANEVAKVKQVLEGKSHQELLSLPVMSESQKMAAMQFLNHALVMAFIARPRLNPILVFRMVRISIESGITNLSAFAFAGYGGWLMNVSGLHNDIEGGYRMGRVAIEMIKRLGAVEMTARVYATVYGFINIWKDPWQVGQNNYLEAYESGAATGDVAFALTNLFQHINTAIYGCGNNLPSLLPNIQSYAKRAFQCNQRSYWISLTILQQLALGLMNVEENAFAPYSCGMTEDSCLTSCRENNEIAMSRFIFCKRKYVAFFKGDLDTAAEMLKLGQMFSLATTGRQVSTIVSTFVDGLIGLFLAREHSGDEREWTLIGLEAIESFRKWKKNSEWNFENKLYLLEAEFYFLREMDDKAMDCYEASIKSARAHRFVHEEGLAEEKAAMYLLNKGRHGEAMNHFVNAKTCYGSWGAHSLVQRVDKAIKILAPLVVAGSEV